MKCPVCLKETTSLICQGCRYSYGHARVSENNTLAVIEWAANRARKAEHKRMSDRVKELELKLRIEIATTDGLIRKYGTTKTEIGDMNGKRN